ncbi:MAG: hypothetical protein F6J96_29970 [Symploca sp. SIO1C2]|nr:hypothetical protein [Symploca sp. SIO1C2]
MSQQISPNYQILPPYVKAWNWLKNLPSGLATGSKQSPTVSGPAAAVLSLTGVLILFAITLPVACWRVSQSEKYGGLPLKSLTTEDTQKPQSSYPD